MLADAARVHQDEARILRLFGGGVTFLREDPEYDLGVRHVHLAAVCLYKYLAVHCQDRLVIVPGLSEAKKPLAKDDWM